MDNLLNGVSKVWADYKKILNIYFGILYLLKKLVQPYHTNMNYQKNKKIWILTFITVLIVTSVLVYNRDWVKAYYHNFTQNHYHYGDPIQINDKYFMTVESLGFPLCRIAKSDAGYDFVVYKEISGKKIQQYQSKTIGTYVGYKMIPLKAPNGEIFVSCLYAIKPTSQLVEKSLTPMELKPGYKIIDDNYYIFGISMFK